MRRQTHIKNKHWIGRKASLKSLKRYCMEIWSELVKARDDHKCILCGETKYVQAHHIISRKFAPTRYDENCGVSVCSKHHAMGLVSAHQTPWIIYEWLESNRPEQYAWFLANRDAVKNPPPMILDLQFYRDKLKYLMDRFEEVAPQVLKKSKYNKFTNAEEEAICKDYIEKVLSRRDLASKYETNEQVIENILKYHNVKMRSCGTLSKELVVLKKKLNQEEYDDPSGKEGVSCSSG